MLKDNEIRYKKDCVYGHSWKTMCLINATLFGYLTNGFSQYDIT